MKLSDYVIDFIAAHGCEIVCDSGKVLVDLRFPALEHFGPGGAFAARVSMTHFERNPMFFEAMQWEIEGSRCIVTDQTRGMSHDCRRSPQD